MVALLTGNRNQEYWAYPPQVVTESVTHRWCRPADQTNWHAVTGPELGLRTPLCGAVPWLRQPGEARLDINTGQAFGPVCGACARAEGL